MSTYFATCKTLDELKKLYKRLAMQHHPDRGGDEATMKAINNEYEQAFARLNSGAKVTNETASSFIDVVNALVALDGIEVELCGSWLWISGDTRPVKEQLKACGCRWSNGKKKWYWCPNTNRKRRRGSYSMAQIRAAYGSQVLSKADNKRKAIPVHA